MTVAASRGPLRGALTAALLAVSLEDGSQQPDASAQLACLDPQAGAGEGARRPQVAQSGCRVSALCARGGNLSADPLGGKVTVGLLNTWCLGEVGLPKRRGDPGSLLSRPGPRWREGVHRLGTGPVGSASKEAPLQGWQCGAA